jgi:membrane associated rhomboid family serine protease
VGVADRSYMRGRGPQSISFGTSWTLRFMVLLVAAFVLTNGAAGWFRWRGEGTLLLSRESIEEGRVWTVVTAALLHADAWHLLFNAIGLWFFGKLVEETLGGARFVAFFFAAAVVSHLPFLAAEFATGGSTRTIGASGIVMAAIVFAAFRFPGLPIRLIVVPLVLWQFAALYVAFDVLGLVSRGESVDHWTHLGGAAFGWIVHRFGLVPNFRLPRRAPKAPREPGPYRDGNTRAEIDRILDKINVQGIAALTDGEREFLKHNAGEYR